MPIHCDIVSQDRIVFSNDVDMVILPGADGLLGILPNHSPLLTTLKFGIITIKSKALEEDEFFTVAGGVAEVLPDQITVLADAAENVAEIDLERAEAARQRAEELLKTKSKDDKNVDEYLTIQAALQRSNLRLNAVQRYRQNRK